MLSALKNSQWIRIFLASLFVGLPSLLRQHPYGIDSYYYLWLFDLPEQIVFPVVVFSAFVTMLLVVKLAHENNVKDKWLTPILLLSAPLFWLRFNEFEDDLIGIPCMIYITLLFQRLYEGRSKHPRRDFIICLAGVMVGYWVWKGTLAFALVFFIALAARYKHGWLLSLILLLTAPMPKPDTAIGENALGAAWFIVGIGGLFIGYKKFAQSKQFLKIMLIVFTGLGLLVTKLIVLTTIPLAIYTTLFLQEHKYRVAIISMLLVLGSGITFHQILTAPPTQEQVATMQQVAGITNKEPISNEWTYGHWLRYYGASPLRTPSNPTTVISLQTPRWELLNATLANPRKSSFCSQELCLERV